MHVHKNIKMHNKPIYSMKMIYEFERECIDQNIFVNFQHNFFISNFGYDLLNRLKPVVTARISAFLSSFIYSFIYLLLMIEYTFF